MLSPVLWCYGVFGAVIVTAIITLCVRRGGDAVLWLGAVCYAAPLAAFGSQHLTLHRAIAALIPPWIPWHDFWAYFVGTCFIAAGLSLVTRVQGRLAASLVALVFFLFVLLMDIPGWLHQPGNRFALALALRELAFSGGALAGAAALTGHRLARGPAWLRHTTRLPLGRAGGPASPSPAFTGDRRLSEIQATAARYFVAIAILYYSLEQFLHANYVPGIPLNRVTPPGLFGHAFWTYFAAVIYAVAGVLLLRNKHTRSAATALGATVLVVVAAVYVPMAVALRNLIGFNFLADTLMFAGALFLLAAAMPVTPSASAGDHERDKSSEPRARAAGPSLP
ncbi:MAG: hypothetical protein EPN33_12750 [Acidobacteria bacterium]|nr:MAG: hypothetical protein EPN33_12750 [Acidobacteriota bacterium]